MFTASRAADVACVLESFRDAKPGKVEWLAEGDLRAHAEEYYIQADRSVFVVVRSTVDGTNNRQSAAKRVLRPASDFAACLAMPDARGRAVCLTTALTGPGTPCPVAQ